MKQILLMRHAKSDWDHPGLKDYDRPLSKRGMNDAPVMGGYLQKIEHKPDLLISSPATRARQTTELVAKDAGLNEGQISWNKDMYYGGVTDYIQAIQGASEEVSRLMLVGHNPLMEHTVSLLAGSDQELLVRMPTAALVCLDVHALKWSAIKPGHCTFKWMMIPKVLNLL